MKKNQDHHANAAKLRRQAEERLKAREQTPRSAFPVPRSDERLVHELEVHQIELEMQNEELVQSRAQVEAALRQYTDLYDFAPVGYFALARDGAIHQVNLTGANLLGVERDKLIGRRFGIFLSPQSRTDLSTLLEKVFGSQQKETCEVALQKDGTVPLWVHIEATASEDGQGCRAAVVDVSELKRTEQALRISEEKFMKTFQSSPDVILLTTVPDGKIVDVNISAVHITGYSVEELLGRTTGELGLWVDPNARDEYMVRIHRDGRVANFETNFRTKSGAVINGLISGEIIQLQTGPCFLSVVRDITERVRADDKLQTAYAHLEKQSAILAQQTKMSAIGVLVAGVAHELNNPLMAMLHFAQYCLKHIAQDNRSYTVLQDIEHETRRCIDIVKDLLTFSHSGDGWKERYEIQNTAEILERVLRLLSYRIEKEGVSITSHVDEETPKIRMHVNAMQDVFLNLLTNALDALEESKTKEVRVDVRPDGDGVRMSIADSGIGISPEALGNIYDPFFTTKPVGRGIGLGLSLCQGVIHAHGGEITCESEPGKGTVFHVFIPTQRRKGAKRDEAHFSD